MGRAPPPPIPSTSTGNQIRRPGQQPSSSSSPSQTRPPRGKGLLSARSAIMPPPPFKASQSSQPSLRGAVAGSATGTGNGSSGSKRGNKKRRNSFKPPLPVRQNSSIRRMNVPASPVVSVSGSIRAGSRRRSGMSHLKPALALERRGMGANVAAGLNNGAVLQEESGAANIRVAVRVRPENQREVQHGMRNVVEIVDEQMLIFDPKDNGDEFFFKGKLQSRRDLNKRVNRDHKFAFDVVFGPQATNEQVFDRTTKDLVDVLFNGYNCSVFVYGSTGAGKTYTMLGSPENPGLTYRTVLELYQRLEMVQEEVSTELAVSYLEIYNETVIDLINPGPQLTIREDGNNGVNIPGLSLHKPEGPEHLLQILQSGNANRTQHPTDANAESSRSHAVFQVYLKQRSRTADLSTDVKVAKLSMIDLAGSERGTVAMAAGAKRLREGANINRSLLALGNCINSLADGSKYVPFRDSKLTRLLKDSIGGNCRTVMISNVTPNALQFEDTYNTLKYADRAKRIKIRLRKNVTSVDFHVAQYVKAVDTLKAEIETLKAKNQTLVLENEDLKEKLLSSEEPTTSTPRTTTTTESSSCQTDFPEKDLKNQQEKEEDEKAHLLVIQSLTAKLRQFEDRQKDHEAIKSRLELLEKQNKNNNTISKVRESERSVTSGLESAVNHHKRLREALENERQLRKKLQMKVNFAQNILERSQLVALDDGSNAKIAKYVKALKKKLGKLDANEKVLLERLTEDRKGLDASLKSMEARGSVGGTSDGVLAWQARFHRLDLKLHTNRHHMAHMMDVLGLHSEETARIDGILKRCLPLLKKKHLLLCSLDQSYEAREHQEFVDLVASVQCTKVQFNDLPGVKSFTPSPPAESPMLPQHFAFSAAQEAQPAQQAKPAHSASSRRLSVCGLDSQLSAIVSIEEEEENSDSDCVMEWSNIEPSGNPDLNGTFSLSDNPAQKVDSTFVVEEEDDDVFAESVVDKSSPKLPWRPATPPKKSRLSQEKENCEAVLSKAKSLQRSTGSFSKFPLKPSNN